MRVLIQRVSRASVSVAGEIIGDIGPGLTAFVGIRSDDTAETARWMAEKVVNLRIFEDEAGKMNRSVRETNGSILAISQFTLYGEVLKGLRPNFLAAAPPEHAEPIYEIFLGYLVGHLGKEQIASGKFRAMMRVELVNEGPVTLLLER